MADTRMRFYTDTEKYLKAIRRNKQHNTQLEYLSVGFTDPNSMRTWINLSGIVTCLSTKEERLKERRLIKDIILIINHETLHHTVFKKTRYDHPEWIVECLNGERKKQLLLNHH